MIGNKPQPIDQAIDNFVVAMLQEKPELDQEHARQSILEIVDELMVEAAYCLLPARSLPSATLTIRRNLVK